MSESRLVVPGNLRPRPLIMVVEDEDGIRGALATFLEDEGFAVACARNGLEALDSIADGSARPALIVLDLMMPVMDGWTFCKLRQGVRALQGIPVLVMSAGSMAGSRQPLRADATISKPFDPDQLAWLAARLVGARAAS